MTRETEGWDRPRSRPAREKLPVRATREQLKGGEAISHLEYKYIIFICSGYCAHLK